MIENHVPIPNEREVFDFYVTHEFLADPKSTLLTWGLLLITVDLDDYLPDMQPQHHFRQYLILAVLALIVNFLNSNHLVTCLSV